MEAKIDQKSIEKSNQDEKLSRYLFFNDWGRFLKPSWDRKSKGGVLGRPGSVGANINTKSDPKLRRKSIQISCKIGQILLQNRSKIHFFPHGPMGYTPSGAVLAKIAKNGSRDLIPGGLLGAKLAALGSQDGATDGQVGGTWEPKRGQHGKSYRFLDR